LDVSLDLFEVLVPLGRLLEGLGATGGATLFDRFRAGSKALSVCTGSEMLDRFLETSVTATDGRLLGLGATDGGGPLVDFARCGTLEETVEVRRVAVVAIAVVWPGVLGALGPLRLRGFSDRCFNMFFSSIAIPPGLALAC